MSIRAALHHATRYTYDRPINLGPQIIRLRPAPHCRTPIVSYRLDVQPPGHFLNWQQDPQANWLARVLVPEPTDHFTVTVDLVADLAVINPFDFFLEAAAERYPFAYDPTLAHELTPYLVAEPLGARFETYLASIDRSEQATTSFVFALNAAVQREIAYLIRMEPGVQTPDETLERRSGSCRDSAWLLVNLLRRLGLAARFASGYLIQLKPDVEALDGPSGASHDFTDLHAWCEVYLPGAGWVGLDPTSGLFAGEGHIPLACAASPVSASPISGTVDPCEVTFGFDMSVARVHEPPRVTKPYTAAQWSAIDRLGDRVDDALRERDVRLTMGGEPTFVAIDDVDAGEWTTDAVGPTKRAFADTLIRRLRDRFAPGGLLHYGQGKWYPGESLPRWAFALYWRGDGMPLWRDADRIARESADAAPTVDDAANLARGIARRIEIDPSFVAPAYEDARTLVGKEADLPINVTALDSKLDDPEERARLARSFARGLNTPAAFVLPVQRWNAVDARPRWRSEQWSTRSGRVLLVPGDSPAGLRLPLASLPHLDEDERPVVAPRDPFAPLQPLPPPNGGGEDDDDPYAPHDRYVASGAIDARRRQQFVEQGIAIDGSVRTAISVEPRDGRLCVFMPPTESAADYLELLGAVEATAAELQTPVHVEGYAPPYDPRINVIKVTPDPGVIEVNIHPARSWRESVAITTALYAEARQSRLATEKFQLDGKHTGTGGGNHIVVGAATPADSPFLRRPDLLRSIVAFWQNHPSLSYLFSGLFIGPTSQAPRVDEARLDSLYELELAFAEVPPRSNARVSPWLVDRIFRNLLIDVTGSTHRTEICIDKLYSPDGPTGRLGLVEFRSFEMPPHAEMSLAQQLLIRALIARFWETPYENGLVRWGTALHDRFMLPNVVWNDFLDVLRDLDAHGFAFDPAWFRPHLEFRFPLYGTVQYDGVKLELRGALEPWNVMGEEASAGGTVRYVDGSVERLEVTISGYTAGRHHVLVNGRRVPLTATGVDAAIGGVRYRAWRSPHALHPTIKPNVPLVCEIYDAYVSRSLGGCTYHVAHPGGRNYTTFPVNAYEAEGRRLARFEPFGFTPGTFVPPPAAPHPDFPHTLDLRRR
jgi:uncharacterized protein (DUF2126 family)/transglutaminase-like putative cysteine protease